MSKAKIAYVCNDCGSEYTKWQGQCNDCGAWNTLSEIRISTATQRGGQLVSYSGSKDEIKLLKDVDLLAIPRINSGFDEFDRVLGGGLVAGSAVLIGGNPGAGKSTLLLQIMSSLSNNFSTLYITGEESIQQVAMRAKRLGLPSKKLQLATETNIESVISIAQKYKPKVMVVDSIQVMHTQDLQSAPGGVSQVRECAAYLTRFAKQSNTIVFLVGHVTKDGSLAGPKVLEHMIDCSLLIECSSDNRFRTLRGQKNRFGAVNELGVFAMTEQGLKEVKNPSAIFLSRPDTDNPGSVVTVLWEGTRSLLVEIQALVDDSQSSNPKRLAVGLDQNRLSMLLAVLNRHGNIGISSSDVFVNVVGGIKAFETGVDLALVLAVVSSFRNLNLPDDLIVFGEVGLSGEIRPVTSGQERLYEAKKLGFKKAIIPKANLPKKSISGINIQGISKLTEALELL
jgi:DNA repair protein RadA/Sms